MERVLVIGTSGSGKSTLSARLASRYDLTHLELDSFVHGPEWHTVPADVYRQNLELRMTHGRWVCDGNYFDRTEDWVWPLVDTVVWLDMPLWRILPRLVRRSLRRIATREELWNGNREVMSALLSRDSVVSWAVQSHRTHAAELPNKLTELAQRGATTVRLRSPRELEQWWVGLPQSRPS